jgi:hypothetical protein
MTFVIMFIFHISTKFHTSKSIFVLDVAIIEKTKNVDIYTNNSRRTLHILP